MSNGEPDLSAQKAEKEAEILRQRRNSADGKLADRPRKIERVGTIEARNSTERIWQERFGTVTPIPQATLRRTQGVITAAVLRIHFNVQWREAAKMVNMEEEYLMRVGKEDKWEEFQQALTQMTKPSLLSLVPQHDMAAIAKETARRIKTIEDLIKKEEKLMAKLPKAPEGSLMESGIISSIKKIRDLIDRTIGLDAYQKESSDVRKQVNAAQVKMLTGDIADTPAPRSTKGTVIPL